MQRNRVRPSVRLSLSVPAWARPQQQKEWRIQDTLLRGAKGFEGRAPSGGAGDRAPARERRGGGEAPRSWSIGAFCVIVFVNAKM